TSTSSSNRRGAAGAKLSRTRRGISRASRVPPQNSPTAISARFMAPPWRIYPFSRPCGLSGKGGKLREFHLCLVFGHLVENPQKKRDVGEQNMNWNWGK